MVLSVGNRLGFSATERKTARGDAQETKDSIGKSLYPAARRSVSSISRRTYGLLGIGETFANCIIEGRPYTEEYYRKLDSNRPEDKIQCSKG